MRWNSDKKIFCSSCKKKPAENKKYELCHRCYLLMVISDEGKFRKNLETGDLTLSQLTEGKYQYKTEVLFGQRHPNFIYQPATFYLGNFKYTPDFYDPIHNEFYEIVGSRQRFEQLKNKIKRFRQFFPNIKLLMVCGDGRPYHSTKEPEIIGNPRNMELFS